jgi:hypothetical protein
MGSNPSHFLSYHRGKGFADRGAYPLRSPSVLIKSHACGRKQLFVSRYLFTGVMTLCVGLGLSYGFVAVHFSGMGSLAPRPNPNLEDQGLHFV